MATDFNIKILVAPLDWGLGHASRCVPLIKHLNNLGCTVIVAADGAQQKLLQIEFPHLQVEHLEGYNIRYSNSKRWFSLKIIYQFPKILKAIKKEHRWLNDILKKHNIDAIISDNRYGLWHPEKPVAFITHQLNIKTPFARLDDVVRNMHYRFINRFMQCWVPDFEGEVNLAGFLSHPKKLPGIPVKYLGAISRFDKQMVDEEYEVLIVLSGPEPQRSIFENKILQQLKSFNGKALMVRGLPGETKEHAPINQTKVLNHLPANELETAFSKSKYIISRSGYTTVMDIIKLEKKSILIATPGQTEQEYLADHLQQQNFCLAASQDDFKLEAVLQNAVTFNYKVAGINMEMYKDVLNNFVADVAAKKKKD